MLAKAIIIPFISALIGYLTNIIAIRLLFYPREPVRLPLLGWQIQGLLPKRREDLARDVGKVIEQELLPLDNLLTCLHSPEVQSQVAGATSEMVAGRLVAGIPPFVPRRLVQAVEDAARSVIQKEVPAIFERVSYQLKDLLRNEISVADLVEERIRQYELSDLERLINGVAHRELRQIEWLGGIIGFLIGLIQLGLIYVFR